MEFSIDKAEIEPVTKILGAAVLDSQRLEYSISFLICLFNNECYSVNNDDKIVEQMESLSKKTLGSLVEKLKKVVTISPGLIDKLNDSLEARNYIIHRFFNDRSDSLITLEGRQESIRLLKEKRKILVEGFKALDPFIQAIMQIRGFNLSSIMDDISERYEHE